MLLKRRNYVAVLSTNKKAPLVCAKGAGGRTAQLKVDMLTSAWPRTRGHRRRSPRFRGRTLAAP